MYAGVLHICMCMSMSGQSQKLTQWFTKCAQHNIKLKYSTAIAQTVFGLAMSFISKMSFNTCFTFSGVETS